MYILLLILVMLRFVVYPLIMTVRQRKKPFDFSALTEREKSKLFNKSMAFIWGATLVLITLSMLSNISLYDIGFRGINLNGSIWFIVIVLTLCGLLSIGLICKTIVDLVRLRRKKEQKTENRNEVILSLLPRSKKERIHYFFISLTAGICEEIIFRGLLFFLLQTIFPNMAIPFVLATTSVIFGIGHIYQGVLGGAVRATITGTIYGSLFLVTNSLLPVILLHFIFDISDVFSLSERTK